MKTMFLSLVVTWAVICCSISLGPTEAPPHGSLEVKTGQDGPNKACPKLSDQKILLFMRSFEQKADAVSSLEQNLLMKLEEMTSNLSATNKNPICEASLKAINSVEQKLLMKLEEMSSKQSLAYSNSLEAINSVDQKLLMILEDMPSKQSLTHSLKAINSVEQKLLMKLEEMSSKQSLADSNSHDAVSSLDQNLLMKLEEMTSNLSPTIKNSTFEVLQANCRPPFAFVDGGCLFRERSQWMTWSKARVFCQERGADLAVFKDVKDFEAIKLYLNHSDSIGHWIGGTDVQEEDRWLWIDGDAMPRGSPYWGIYGGILPFGGTGENCAVLHAGVDVLIFDTPCNETWKPLCQYFPSA